jgi:hypothetical protein
MTALVAAALGRLAPVARAALVCAVTVAGAVAVRQRVSPAPVPELDGDA